MMPKFSDKSQNALPRELTELKEWIAWFKAPKIDPKTEKPKLDPTTKRPLFGKLPLTRRGYSIKNGEPGFEIERAVKDANEAGDGVGLLMNERHQYVAFDLDHVGGIEDLPSDEFKQWLAVKDSYTEESPSGNGIRIIFKCVDKEKVKKGYPPLVEELCGEGNLYSTSGYVTMTGRCMGGTEIKEVTAYELERWITLTKPKVAEVIPIDVDFKYPEFSLIKEALLCCKLDKCDRVKRAYETVFNEPYNHYNYWFRIVTACHDYAVKTNKVPDVLQVVFEWSQTDEEHYVGDASILDHWSSLTSGDSDGNITYKTLMKFGQLLQFEWPVPKRDKNGELTGRPIPQAGKNIEYLLGEYFNLNFFWDTFGNKMYVTGDKTILKDYFYHRGEVKPFFGMVGPFKGEVLESIIIDIIQANKYENIEQGRIRTLWRNYTAGRIKNINTFKMWLETPADELPEDMIEHNTDLSISNVEGLMSCIDFVPNQNLELTKTFFEIFFHSMVMPLYNTQNMYAERPFILLIVGKQAARKTSFCNGLFPPNLSPNYVLHSSETLKSDKSVRDFKISLCKSVLVIKDEIDEIFRNDSDALVKSLVTTSTMDYTPIYSKTNEHHIRQAMIIGTSNETDFRFDPEGSRRFAMLHVNYIDTNKLARINKHHLYRQFFLEGKKKFAAFPKERLPWQVSDEVMQIQYKENEKHRTTTNYEEVFNRLFDASIEPHDYKAKSPQLNEELWKIKQIKGLLAQEEGRSEGINDEKKLVRALEQFCGLYTHTLNRYDAWGKNGCVTINKGVIKTNNRKLYVLPPLFNGNKPENYGF